VEKSHNVKRRTYDATARRAQSAGTRQRIVDTALALLLERGYRATTVAAVASGPLSASTPCTNLSAASRRCCAK
jgi:hypothetical protein